MVSSPRKRGPIVPKTVASGMWVPACAGTTRRGIGDLRAPSPYRARNANLIDRALALGGVEREGGNVDVELLAGGGDHAVGSGHETGRRRQRHAAGVLEVLAGLEHRLLADHARAAHLLQAPLRV